MRKCQAFNLHNSSLFIHASSFGYMKGLESRLLSRQPRGFRNAANDQKLAHPKKMDTIKFLILMSKLLIFFYL